MDLYWISFQTKGKYLLCCLSPGFCKSVTEFKNKTLQSRAQTMASDPLGLTDLNPASAPYQVFFSFRDNSPTFQFDVTSLYPLDNEDHSVYLLGLREGMKCIGRVPGTYLVQECLLLLLLLNSKIFGQLSLSVKGNESHLVSQYRLLKLIPFFLILTHSARGQALQIQSTPLGLCRKA